jgi:hypothetical protein
VHYIAAIRRPSSSRQQAGGVCYIIYNVWGLKELKILCFLVGKFFQNFKMDKKNVQKRKGEKSFPEIHVFAA